MNHEQTKQWVLERDAELKDPNKWSRYRKQVLKGFVVVDCKCQMYHTVELGKVNILKPGDVNG